MGSDSDSSSRSKANVATKPAANYRVRFRHGVYPKAEGQATRAEIKKYDYFFSGGQPWVHTSGNGMLQSLLLCVVIHLANPGK
jgi:hypothetical protein